MSGVNSRVESKNEGFLITIPHTPQDMTWRKTLLQIGCTKWEKCSSFYFTTLSEFIKPIIDFSVKNEYCRRRIFQV